MMSYWSVAIFGLLTLSGLAIHEAFAERWVGIIMQDHLAYSEERRLDVILDVSAFEVGGTPFAILATAEGPSIIRLSNPGSIIHDTIPQINHTEAIKQVAAYKTSNNAVYVLVTYDNDAQQRGVVQVLSIDGGGGLSEIPTGTSIVEHTTMFNPLGLDVYSIGAKRYAVVTAEATITTTKEAVTVNGTITQEESVDMYHAVNIVDISDPTNVHIEGRIQDGAGLVLNSPQDIATYSVGNRHYAVVAGFRDSGVQIIDVTDPANPTAAGNIRDTNNILLHAPRALDVYSEGNKHYAAVLPRTNTEEGIQILDITDPANPTAAGKLTDTTQLDHNSGNQLTIHKWNYRHYAVTAHDIGKVDIVDVTDPDNPVAQAQLVGDYGSSTVIGALGVDTFSIGDRHYAVVGTLEEGVIVFEMAFLTADAGPYQAATSGDTITLDGSHYIATPGKTPTYKWELIDGLPITISDSTAQSPTFVAPPSKTILTLQLTTTIPKSTTNLGAVGTVVSDIVSTDTVSIFVNPASTESVQEEEQEQQEEEQEQQEEEQEQQEEEQEQQEEEQEQQEEEQEQQEEEQEQQEEEQEQQQQTTAQEPDLPALVQQYDTDGSGVIEQDEWEVAIVDYVNWELTTPEIQLIAAHRG